MAIQADDMKPWHSLESVLPLVFMARASLLTLLSGLCKRPLPPRPLFYLLTAAILGFTLLASLFTPNLRSAHTAQHIYIYIYIYMYIYS
jgi:hypothetical protein